MNSANAPQQLPLGVSLRDDARFENFQVGENGLVCEIVKQAARGEGDQFVFLWGGSGFGCSHLLQAACHASDEFNRQAVYLPLNDLDRFTPSILEGLEYLDLVCLDNIEYIAGHADWEEAVFHFFNRIRQEDNKLVVGANAAPRHLNIQLPDLQSRLTWGMAFNLVELDDEDKIRAIQLRAKTRGFELPDEVAKYLVHHSGRSMSQLCDKLEYLDKASLMAKRKVTIPFIKSEMGW